MTDFNAEGILAGAINEWLAESDIDGKTVNQENLDRLNKANIMALKIFDNPQEVEFEKPRRDLAFAQTRILYAEVDIVKSKNSALFIELINTVDSFSLSPIDGRTIGITFTVDNIWEGEPLVSPYAVMLMSLNRLECETFKTLEDANAHAFRLWNQLTDEQKGQTEIKVVADFSECEEQDSDNGMAYEYSKETPEGGFNSNDM